MNKIILTQEIQGSGKIALVADGYNNFYRTILFN